jgi:hypothetical protein
VVRFRYFWLLAIQVRLRPGPAVLLNHLQPRLALRVVCANRDRSHPAFPKQNKPQLDDSPPSQSATLTTRRYRCKQVPMFYRLRTVAANKLCSTRYCR